MEAGVQPAAPTAGYPIRFDLQYKEPLSRVTTLFRIILAIPQFVVIYILAIVAEVLAVIVWFAILFTGRYPRGIFNFMTFMARWFANVNVYLFLASDEYPPFSGDAGKYPGVNVEFDYPEGELSRLSTFLRLILVIPHVIVLSILGIIAYVITLIAWIAIIITGKYPRGMFNFVAGVLRWQVRVNAYGYFLFTDKYPPFSFD